jgi:hypothetical protein
MRVRFSRLRRARSSDSSVMRRTSQGVTAGLRGSHYQRDHRGPVPIALAALCDPVSSSGI